jgi:hypothetical protein
LPPGAESFGPAAVQWGREHLATKRAPWVPFPWQEIALGHQLAHVNGTPVTDQHLVSVARQNGKTSGLFRPLVGWWLSERCKLMGEPQVVLSTADRLDKASRFMRQMGSLLEEQYGAQVYKSYGREQVIMPCGCEWHVTAANESAGHSLSCDLVLVDEIWKVPSLAYDDGLLPTTIARPAALVASVSTAGEERSDVMLRLREAGLRAIDTGVPGEVGLVEWSVPADMEPMDQRYWGWANPALGQSITVDRLVQRSEGTRSSFLRAHLNMWVPASDGWLDAGEWAACAGEFDMPAGGYVVVEQSMDEARFVGLRAVGVDGRALVGTAFVVSSEQEMWQRLLELGAGDATLKFAVGGSMEVHVPPTIRARTELVGAAEIKQWLPLVSKVIRSGSLVHRGEVLLSEHVCRAVSVPAGDGMRSLSIARSPGPIELARCLIWATALATKPGKRKVAVGMGGGGR